MRRPVKLALLCGAAVVLTGVTIGISAQFVIAAVGGDAAIRHHKHAYLAEVTRVLSDVEGQMRAADQQSGQVGQVVSELQSLLACELLRGCVSGRGGGPGTASQEIERILASMSVVNDSVSSASQVQTVRLDEVRAEIERARTAIREGDDAAFTDAVARLHAALSRAAGNTSGGVSANALLASRYPQIAALGRRLLQADSMPGRLDLDRETPVYLPVDKYEATQAHADKVVMAHVMGVSVELLPLLAFLLTLLASQIRRADDLDGDGGDSGQRQLETGHPDILQFGKRGVPAE